MATSVVYAIQMAGPSVGFLLGLGIKNSHLVELIERILWYWWVKGVIQDLMKEWSRQILATSHDLTANGGLVKEILYFREI